MWSEKLRSILGVGQAPAGLDVGAVEELYRVYGPTVYGRALQLLRNKEDARDVLQDVFVTALTKGHTFRGASATTTWLYAITTRKCTNRLRAGRRRGDLLAGAGENLWMTGTAPPEVTAALGRVFARLPEEMAVAAILYYHDDLSQAEVAEVLGCSRRKVGNLLERMKALIDAEDR